MRDFENAAARAGGSGIVGEFWYFLKTSRKWLMLPLLIAIVILGVLVFLSGTAAAPFLYTLF